MRSCRSRWGLLLAALVGLVSCELNPQPPLPDRSNESPPDLSVGGGKSSGGGAGIDLGPGMGDPSTGGSTPGGVDSPAPGSGGASDGLGTPSFGEGGAGGAADVNGAGGALDEGGAGGVGGAP